MRVTIVPEDQIIIIDGDALKLAFDIDPTVHAIQWDGAKGVIERKIGGAESFTDIAVIQPYVDAWQAAHAIATAPPPPPSVQQLRATAKAARAVAVAAITVTVGDKTFDGDETSQTRMARAIIGMQAANAPTINWTLANNVSTPVTVAELTEALILSGQRQAELWPLP